LGAKEFFGRELAELTERNFHPSGRQMRLNKVEREFQLRVAFRLRTQALDDLRIKL
jgi:hypothetical protein